MPTRSPSAYVASVLLHGSVVGLILLLAYLADETSLEKPKVFELVAGAGDNYGATEAPALGSPDGIKLNLPAESPSSATAAPLQAAVPTPVAPEPVSPPEAASPDEASPIQPAPLPAKAKAKPKTAPKTKADQMPNLTKVVQRTENRRVARLMTKYKKQLEAEERRQQMSYDQYLKQHGGESRADAEGIHGGVVGGSTANKTGGAGGKALTREQGELLDAYFALLKARIHENHLPPPDASDKLRARVQFNMAANGVLSHVRIIESSGNADFDQSVLEAFAHTHSIGPRPDGRSESGITLEFQVREDDSE